MPVPGDEIVGFITRGYGVSIHRTDCKNYVNAVSKDKDKERWINVYWADDLSEKYETGLAITASDRNGLVMDIATVLNSLKVKVNALTARDIGGVASVFITIEVKDRNELGSAIARLLSVQGVKEVKRQGA